MNRNLFKVAYRGNYTVERIVEIKSLLGDLPEHEYIVDIVKLLFYYVKNMKIIRLCDLISKYPAYRTTADNSLCMPP